jgi:hypothetical protein
MLTPSWTVARTGPGGLSAASPGSWRETATSGDRLRLNVPDLEGHHSGRLPAHIGVDVQVRPTSRSAALRPQGEFANRSGARLAGPCAWEYARPSERLCDSEGLLWGS